MKKQISMLLATACAASLLAACGGSGSTAASASAADSTAASSEETAADAASLYENAQKPDKLVWWVHDGMHQEDGSEQWIARGVPNVAIGDLGNEIGIADGRVLGLFPPLTLSP